MKRFGIQCFILFLIVSFTSCNTTSPDAQSGPQLSILHKAGDNPDQLSNYLPYPTHYGKIAEYHVLLLSHAPNPGSTRSIIPVGMLAISVDGNPENWIIANDAHDDYNIDDLNDVNDLMTTHNRIKSVLETWILNRAEIGSTQLKVWKEAPSIDESNNQ